MFPAAMKSFFKGRDLVAMKMTKRFVEDQVDMTRITKDEGVAR